MRHSLRFRAQTPGGSKRLQDREHGFDFGLRGAEPLGDRLEIAGEIAGLVDQVDQMAADHAPHRIRDRERKLLAQVIRERRLGRDEGLEIVVAVLAPARADAGPFRIGGGLGLRRPLAAPRPSPGNTFSMPVSKNPRSPRSRSPSAASTGRFGGGFLAAGCLPGGPSLERSSSGLRSSSPST